MLAIMDRSSLIDDALAVLLSDEQAAIVDLVLCARDGTVEAHARDGSVGFQRDGTIVFQKGRNPLEKQDPSAFSPLDDEMQHVRPSNETNEYPYANANVLYAMADAGELPNVARLMRDGTTFDRGCIASFPSVTLANHTTALTGAHPGRHGVLHNFYYDRATGRQIVTNSPDTWQFARE